MLIAGCHDVLPVVKSAGNTFDDAAASFRCSDVEAEHIAFSLHLAANLAAATGTDMAVTYDLRIIPVDAAATETVIEYVRCANPYAKAENRIPQTLRDITLRQQQSDA